MGSGDKIEEGTGVVILHKEDSGRELQMRSGDIIQLELGGAGTTGYWWHAAGLDSARVELLSEETNPSPDKKLMGGSVMGIWRFKAKMPGKTDLTMKYYRVWEGPEKAVDQFSVILDIR